MRKVIFLDRDGVINKERGEHTFRKSDFIFNDGLFESLQKFKTLGYEFVIITNQSGIAKGLYTHEELNDLHTWMLEEFTKGGITILDLFYCPHHEKSGKCICRKPNSSMVERAISKHNVDIKKSYFIGDSDRDIIAGEKMGIQGIKIEPNSSLRLVEEFIAL